MQIWTGTSGYSYRDWVGGFYPPGTRAPRMLQYYCGHFPLVELNFTFYRLPTPGMLTRLAEQTPPGFQFLVKLPRTLSHDKDPRELDAFRKAISAPAFVPHRLGLLCQLPQAAHDEPQHREWIERLARELSDNRLAIEFRHRSWFHAEVPDWLRAHKLDLVSVDVPDLPGLYPRGLVQSSSTVYVRFHSRSARNWYLSEKYRYDFNYSDDVLSEWIDDIGRIAQDADRVLLLFNNCKRSQAASNASRMQQLLRERRGRETRAERAETRAERAETRAERAEPHAERAKIELVEPFAEPQIAVHQRQLFE